GDDRRPERRITPACAGSTCDAYRSTHRRTDHPRVRGEHTVPVMIADLKGGSPPRARGAHVTDTDRLVHDRSTPARAGSTRDGGTRREVRADHPRVRGEHWTPPGTGWCTPGSPPRARGAHLMTRDYSSPPRKTDSLCAAVQALRLRRVRRHRVLTRQRLPHREPRLFGVVAVLVAVADPAPEVDVAAPVA